MPPLNSSRTWLSAAARWVGSRALLPAAARPRLSPTGLGRGTPIDSTAASVAAASATSRLRNRAIFGRSTASGSQQVIGKSGRCRKFQRADQGPARETVSDQAGAGQSDTQPEHCRIDHHPGLAEILTGVAGHVRSCRDGRARSATRCRCRRRRLRNGAAVAAQAAHRCHRPARTPRAGQARRSGTRDPPSAVSPRSSGSAHGKTDRKVDPLGAQIEQTRIGDHLHLKVRVPTRIRGNRGISQCDATDGNIVTLSGAASSSPREIDNTTVDLSDRQFDFPCQNASLRGQFELPRVALEQGKSELFLQSADAVTDCTLREISALAALVKLIWRAATAKIRSASSEGGTSHVPRP